MKFIVKHPHQCNRPEINLFYQLLSKLTLIASGSTIKKISRCYLLGLCVDKSNVVGIGAIKKPHTARIQKLEKYAKVSLSAMGEYGYIYVQAKYRGRGITKKLYTLLLKKIHIPLYVTVKQNNIPMKKLLQQFGFVTVGNSFKSSLDGKLLDIYIQK